MPRPPLHEVGDDPDPRFSMANERTFLAWNRTGLALISVGLAVTQLLPPFDFTGGRKVIGLPLIALGAAVSYLSLREWAANEAAMRDLARAASVISRWLSTSMALPSRMKRPSRLT